MAADIPTTEPSELRAGDTWKWTKSLSDYPASAWTLKYRFKNAAGGFEITATASGDEFSVTVAATTTGSYTAGRYGWAAWVEGGSSEKYTVGQGTCEVLPDLRTGLATAALDVRSDARIIYDGLLTAYKAAVASRAFVSEYEIAGRRMKFNARADWLKEINYWKAQVDAEERAQKIAQGIPVSSGRIQFRFSP